PEPGGDPDVSRRRGADQVRDQALSARRRISAGFGPPKDLVALCSEAIATLPVVHPTPCSSTGLNHRIPARSASLTSGWRSTSLREHRAPSNRLHQAPPFRVQTAAPVTVLLEQSPA